MDFSRNHPTFAGVLLTGSVLYAANKIRKAYGYSLKQFSSKSEISDKVILITGCGHGFGNALALQLSIDIGYRVIATCRTQESVNEFLSNSKFTANKSTAIIMDVTNEKQIRDAQALTAKYLKETNGVLWGLVNNAGLDLYGEFELVPPEWHKLQYDVLLNGPLNIVRAFLPLLQGRMNYVADAKGANNKLEYNANGGRIVNISSTAARIRYGPIRYGVCKAALSYASHALRQELSPRFGIWCSVVEPGCFLTNIFNSSWGQTEKLFRELKQNGKQELLDIYQFDMEALKTQLDQFVDRAFAPDIQPVIDDMIHALTAKYPEREYIPGNSFILSIMERLPLSLCDSLALYGKKANVELQKKR